MTTQIYYPELGDSKPNALIESRLSHYGTHYYVTTELQLKGRGIKELENNRYKVTQKAYELLEKQYDISNKVFLD